MAFFETDTIFNCCAAFDHFLNKTEFYAVGKNVIKGKLIFNIYC